MLCGDLNIDLLYKDCNNSTSFLNTMYSLSLLPIINKPTRITDNSATLIGNFFINVSQENFLRDAQNYSSPALPEPADAVK